MNAGRSRALVLRDVIEIPDFKNIPDPNDPRYSEIKQISQYNPAFVLMQYFGYLRRNVDQGGYDFWLDVVNNREPNNYHGMVCAFITSTEYQLRFGSAVTRSNADCGRGVKRGGFLNRSVQPTRHRRRTTDRLADSRRRKRRRPAPLVCC